MLEPKQIPLALDADSHPEVGWPVEAATQLGQTLRPFRKHLVRVLGRIGDNGKYLLDVVHWDRKMEQVAHGVDENEPRGRPGPRDVERVGMEAHSESRTAGTRITVLLVLGLPHRLETLSESQGIAMVTTR